VSGLEKSAEKEKESEREKSRVERENLLSRRASPSDVTDAQWEIVEPVIPAIPRDAPHVLEERHDIVNAVLSVVRSDCSWRMLPHDVPAWGTVEWSVRRWERKAEPRNQALQ
jgi:hypothetical protein